jgi:hypothetical protein
VIQELEELERRLRRLRIELLNSDADGEINPTLRQLTFIKAFVEHGGSLTAAEVSEAALDAGYDPRGTAGFYRGAEPFLVSDGDKRSITTAGRTWFEANADLLNGGGPALEAATR